MTTTLAAWIAMKYIPLAGAALAIWGLLSGDWFNVAFGALLFFGGFAVDTFKKRAVLKDSRLFAVYRPLYELIRVVRRSMENAEFDAEGPKGRLAQGLFYIGMVDAASQHAGMTDRQFLELFSAVFQDQDFGDPLKSKVLLFHQSLQLDHPAYLAIRQGGETYTKFLTENRMLPVVAGSLLKDIVNRPDFPASVEEL